MTGNSLYNMLREKKNIFFSTIGLLDISTATLAITNKCNQKCIICDFGNEKIVNSSELSSDVVQRILTLRICKKLRCVNITGGEPFCHSEFENIMNIISTNLPQIHITVSSNGILTDKIVNYFKKEHRQHQEIQISLLGISRHGQMSGKQDSLFCVKETIHRLRKNCSQIKIRIKFTITPDNYYDLPDVIAFCKVRGLPLMVKLVENVESYHNKITYEANKKNSHFNFNKNQKENVIQYLTEYKGAVITNKTHIANMITFLKGKTISQPCFANQRSIFITPDGIVYSCRMQKPLGHINQVSESDPKNIVTHCQKIDSSICNSCISIYRSIYVNISR